MFRPNYTITDEILSKIAEIEMLRTQISGSYVLPEREVELRYRATVEATYSSTSIEGNPLSGKQVERVLADASGAQLTRHQYAEIEVRNYKKALDFIEKRKNQKSNLTTKDILTVHDLIARDLLPPKKAGAWRKNPVYIENQNQELVYTAPAPEIVASEIRKLITWLSNTTNVHPIIAAAVFHIQFVSIHPFADGNGRSARVLAMLYLGLKGYDFRSSIVLDSYYCENKRAYYDALHAAQGRDYQSALAKSLNSWLDYFTDGFLSSAKVLRATIAVLSGTIKMPDEVKRIKQDSADLLSYAKQFGSISLSEAEEVLAGVSQRTVQRKLRKLVDDGYLKMTGDARETRYNWKQ
jgi:Fic family protein